jgi:protein-disulfide isomerase
MKASEAALCAGDQGKFWELHDRLFANQNALARKCRAKLEKASDTETGFQVRKTGRAKQGTAGTAGTGGQRRGHPKLMGEKP